MKTHDVFGASDGKIVLSSGVYGWVLSIAIIAARALSPNSAAMEDWSVLSWIFMTCPITWPWIVFVAARVLYWLMSGVIWTSGKARKRFTKTDGID